MLAGLMLLCLPLFRFFPKQQIYTASSRSADQTTSLSSWPVLLCGIVAVLLFYISIGGVWTFMAGIAEQSMISPEKTGAILAIATILGIIGSMTATWIGNRIHRPIMLVTGYVIMLVAILLLLGLPDATRFSLAAFMYKFAWTFVLPFILASLATADASGRLLNTTNLVIGGGLAIGPLISGHLIEASHGQFHLMLSSGFTFGCLSLLLILTLALKQPHTAAAGQVIPH